MSIFTGKEAWSKFLAELESRFFALEGEAPEAMEVSINGQIMTFVLEERNENKSVDEILDDLYALANSIEENKPCGASLDEAVKHMSQTPIGRPCIAPPRSDDRVDAAIYRSIFESGRVSIPAPPSYSDELSRWPNRWLGLGAFKARDLASVSIPTQPSLFDDPKEETSEQDAAEVARRYGKTAPPSERLTPVPVEELPIAKCCGGDLLLSKDVVNGVVKCWRCGREHGTVRKLSESLSLFEPKK